MPDRITLDDIEPEQFDKFIRLLAVWVHEGVVKVRVSPSASTVFKFDEDRLADRLEQNHLPKSCLSQLQTDIPTMVSGILSGQRNIARRILIDHVSPTAAEDSSESFAETVREEISVRMSQVEGKLISDSLKNQYSVKTTAKTNLLQRTLWEIVEKHSENTGSSLPNLKFAIISFQTKRPPSSMQDDPFAAFPFGLDLFSSSRTETVALTMSLEDLEDLAHDINEAINSLKRVISEEGAS